VRNPVIMHNKYPYILAVWIDWII